MRLKREPNLVKRDTDLETGLVKHEPDLVKHETGLGTQI